MIEPKDLPAYIATFVKNDKLGTHMAARFISLTAEECVYEYDAIPQHYNPNGMLHGGALYTVMDSSQGMLIHVALDSEYQAAVTGTATMKYLAPVHSGTVRIRTTISGREGRKIFVRSEATSSDGKSLATLDEIWIAIRR